MPLRDGVALVVGLADGTVRVIQSPVSNTVPGAMQIQEVIEHIEWVSQSGNPVAYAPHIRRSPLAGIAAKSVIYQFAKGDQIVPNPANTAILRAGDLADRATFYRHDLAFAENPQLPTNPHGFPTRLDIPGLRAITRGAQEQIATFFATDGATVIHPEPSRFFEVPISLPLPENLNYILPPTAPRGAVAPMLAVAGTPAASRSGATFADSVPFSLTITVQDAYGNVVTGYTGTIHFTSTPSTASLPANYTFLAADRGVHRVIGLKLRKKGSQIITVTGPLNSSITSSVIVKVV
jgi:hypothetical protein